MHDQREPPDLAMTPGPWIHVYRESQWRIVTAGDGWDKTIAVADLVHPSQANGALIAAAPRMLDLLLRWARAGAAGAEELQREARVLISNLETASATPANIGVLPQDTGAAHDVQWRPGGGGASVSRRDTAVLIVDDDPSAREFLGELLSDAGYVTRTAVNGKEALEQMHQQPPRVVLLDLQMPVMDGWEFRRRQLADPALAQIAVIALTGDGDSREVRDALSMPFLTKPLQLSKLLAELQRYGE